MALGFFSSQTRSALKTLLGSVLCFAGLGSQAAWTNINIFLQKNFLFSISLRFFNIVISLSALIAAILSLVSLQIGKNTKFQIKTAQKFGHKLIIRFSMLLYPLSIIMSTYTTNIYIFIFSYSVLLGSAMGLSMIPLIYCLFSHFGDGQNNNIGKVTGIIMGSLGLFTVGFVGISTGIINHGNQKADIEYHEGSNTTWLFDSDVSENVPDAIFAIGVICLITMFPGSFLISKKENPPQNQIIQQNDESYSIITINDTSNTSDNSQNNTNMQFFEIEEPKPFSVIKYLKKKSFRLLFFTSMNVSLQIFFLSLNFKIYGFEKINDDFYLMEVLIISQIIAAISKFMWGYFIDVFQFRYVLVASLFFGGLFTLTFPFVAENKTCFLIWYTVITVCERGFLTVGPPILIILYGIEDGTKLIPIYQGAFLLGLIGVPVIQILLLKYISYDLVFVCSGTLVILTNYFVLKIKEEAKVKQ